MLYKIIYNKNNLVDKTPSNEIVKEDFFCENKGFSNIEIQQIKDLKFNEYFFLQNVPSPNNFIKTGQLTDETIIEYLEESFYDCCVYRINCKGMLRENIIASINTLEYMKKTNVISNEEEQDKGEYNYLKNKEERINFVIDFLMDELNSSGL